MLYEYVHSRVRNETWNFVSIFEKMASAVSVLVFGFYFVANVDGALYLIIYKE